MVRNNIEYTLMGLLTSNVDKADRRSFGLSLVRKSRGSDADTGRFFSGDDKRQDTAAPCCDDEKPFSLPLRAASSRMSSDVTLADDLALNKTGRKRARKKERENENKKRENIKHAVIHSFRHEEGEGGHRNKRRN